MSNINSKLDNITEQLEFLNEHLEKNKIQEELKELDIKRIRAFLEPSEKEPGISWLDYYNRLIKEKRNEIKI